MLAQGLGGVFGAAYFTRNRFPDPRDLTGVQVQVDRAATYRGISERKS